LEAAPLTISMVILNCGLEVTQGHWN